jgi:hypothetical protein
VYGRSAGGAKILCSRHQQVRKFYTARFAVSRTTLGSMSCEERILRPTFILIAALAAGCGSSNSQPTTSTLAAVSGPKDTHCTDNGVETKQAIGICQMDDGGASTADSGGTFAASTDSGADDGGADGGDDGGGMPSTFGATMYNAEGDDDDCKYHVTWTSTAVKENVGVIFDLKAVRRMDGQPAKGADVQIEAFLKNRPTPSINIPNTESAGGNYKIGPVVFDAPGIWTVRFHLYEMCSDTPQDSPHGHAAFFINVP